jgi:hypothetical protein
MEEELAHLRSLDLIGLQCRWQSVMGRPAPEHLPKHLLFGILAYHCPNPGMERAASSGDSRRRRLRFRGEDLRQPVQDCTRHHRHELERTSLLWPPRRKRQWSANMKPADNRVVRCAIYTRVSTDSGLDQEFNSLDAQYDASQAYIRSQVHAG